MKLLELVREIKFRNKKSQEHIDEQIKSLTDEKREREYIDARLARLQLQLQAMSRKGKGAT